MITITENQLFDYIKCPAFYDMKYNKKLPIVESESMSKLLSKVSKYFYLNLLNQKICSAHELKNKWSSVCEGDGNLQPKKVMEGASLILKLLNWAHSEEPVVLDLDTPYKLSIGEVEVLGQTGTILGLDKDKYELMVTDFSNRMPEQAIIDMKLKYTLDAYSFAKVHRKHLSGIKVRSIKNAANFYTSRSEVDFMRLEKTIESVGKSIELGLFYPREGMCSSCNAKGYCKYWI